MNMNRRESIAAMVSLTAVPVVSSKPQDKTPQNFDYKSVEFWEYSRNENERILALRKLFDNKETELEIVEWLKENNNDNPIKQYSIRSDGKFLDFILFSRSEIYLKSGKNTWDVWRIATCGYLNIAFTYKVKEIGTNQMLPNSKFVMPNEVRCSNYDSENVVWNLIPDKKKD